MPVIKRENVRRLFSFLNSSAPKRKAEPEEVTVLDTKRRKTEQDYFKEQLELYLERATRMASEGDECRLDFFLGEAAENASKLNVNISARTSKIRILLTPIKKHEFAKKEVKRGMESARKFALQGNEVMMQVHLRQAKNHAAQYHTLMEQYNQQANAIARSLTNDKVDACLRKQMQLSFDRAEACAKEGDRFMMMSHLSHAKEKAAKTNTSMEYYKRYRTIENSIKVHQELKFFRGQYESQLKQAEKYAASGNRNLLEFKLDQAKSNGIKAGIPMNEIQKALNRTRNSIATAPADLNRTVKKEVKPQALSADGMSRASRTPLVASSTSNNDSTDDGEVVLEKELTLEERLAIQLQGEERAGRVIQLE